MHSLQRSAQQALPAILLRVLNTFSLLNVRGADLGHLGQIILLLAPPRHACMLLRESDTWRLRSGYALCHWAQDVI